MCKWMIVEGMKMIVEGSGGLIKISGSWHKVCFIKTSGTHKVGLTNELTENGPWLLFIERRRFKCCIIHIVITS